MPERRVASGSVAPHVGETRTVVDAGTYRAPGASSVWSIMAEHPRTPDQTHADEAPPSDAVKTIVDEGLAGRLREALGSAQASNQTAVLAAPAPRPVLDHPNETVILDQRPQLPAPAPHTQPYLAGAPAGTISDRTELSFALPERAPRVRPSAHGENEDRAATTQRRRRVANDETGFQRPVIVAHVIAPRRNYALLAALLAWTFVVMLAVYVVASHRTAQETPERAPAAPTASVLR